MFSVLYFFFFQAEDGIRDSSVTGVQTCAFRSPDAVALATSFFAFSPLLLVYGQAVQPDSCMLAGMLLAAACYRRHLDTGRWHWWLAAAVCGSLAALFKYYGLIVLLPTPYMHFPPHGRPALLSPRLFTVSL